MKCKDCLHFNNIANTNETGQGVCSFPMSYFPTQMDNECAFVPKPYTCGDCSHFVENDTACFTCRAEDSAYPDGELCCGFIDHKESEVFNALVEWKLRGFSIDEKLQGILDEVNEYKAPWEVKK